MLVGVNHHPLDGIPVAEQVNWLIDGGFEAVRFPCWLGREQLLIEFAQACAAANIKIVGILDANSFTPNEIKRGAWARRMRYWRKLLPWITTWQIGNEPDQPDSASSWYMTLKRWRNLWRTAVRTITDCTLLPAGLVHVDTRYLIRGAPQVVHLYAQSPESVVGLLDLVRAEGDASQPIICTEFGWPGEGDATERARYYTDFLIELWQQGVTEAYPYPLTTAQDPDLGLMDTDGTKTEAYAAVVDAVGPLSGEPPSDTPDDGGGPGGDPGAPDEPWYAPVLARARETYGLTPYQFGGDRREGRSEGPWDCAGWVMECFDAAGIDIDPEHSQANTNAERLRQACNQISETELQPGDLVFFEQTYDTPGASHVGIFLRQWVMADDHDRGDGTGPGETEFGFDRYWVSHFLSYGRVRR